MMRKNPITLDLVSAFWAKVERKEKEQCWLWKGKGYGFGYGEFLHENVHRLSFRIHFGEIPLGLCVLHRCDVPLCVNPRHLFIGTKGDNIRDCRNKGRMNRPRGEKTWNSKLTQADVVEMRHLYRSGTMSSGQIAKHKGVSRQTSIQVIRGLRWSSVPGAVTIAERSK